MKLLQSIIGLLFTLTLSAAEWQTINTLINDDINGADIYQSTAVLVGDKGVYYSLNGISDTSEWFRFEVNSNADIYNSTQFISVTNRSRVFYAVGNDTLRNKAVVFKFDLDNFQSDLLYEGNEGSVINNLRKEDGSEFIVCGNNNLLLLIRAYDDTIEEVEVETDSTYNFTDIAFENSTAYLTSDKKMLRASLVSQNTVLRSIVELGTGDGLKGVSIDNGSAWVGSTYYDKDRTPINNYSGGPLNASSILSFYNNHDDLFYTMRWGKLIGTDHGVYVQPYKFANFLEWQPSSGRNRINALFNVGSDYYALANDGVVLKLSNNPGEVEREPFVQIDERQYCIGSNTIDMHVGSSDTYSVIINGEEKGMISSYNFSAPGDYELTVIGRVGGFADTTSHVIEVLDAPHTNLEVLIQTRMVCKENQIEYQVVNSQEQFQYFLEKQNDNGFYRTHSEFFDGGDDTLSVLSSSINKDGVFRLSVRNKDNTPSCSATFSRVDTFFHENPSSRVHVNKVNAYIGDEVKVFAHRNNSDHYQWGHDGVLEELNDTTDYLRLRVNDSRQSVISLIAWTDSLCYDTVSVESPKVITTPSSNNTSFISHQEGEDPTWIGQYTRDVYDMVPTSDGYLVCGANNGLGSKFPSQAGDSLDLSPGKTAYLIKYRENGDLDWYITSTRAGDDDERDFIRNMLVDKDDNIYIMGSMPSGGYLVDNTGKYFKIDVNLPGMYHHSRYVAKLNHKGELLWWRTSDRIIPFDFALNSKEELTVAFTNVYGTSYAYSLDNNLTYNGSIGDTLAFAENGRDMYYLITLDEEGQLKHNFGFQPSWVGDVSGDDLRLKYNNQDKLIFTSYYRGGAFIINNEGLVTQELSQDLDNRQEEYIGVFEFDFLADSCTLLTSFNTIKESDEDYNYSGVVNSLLVDSLNNIYLSGDNNVYHQLYSQQYFNSDGSVVFEKRGRRFLSKLSNTGNLIWSTAVGNGASYGFTGDMFIQNDTIFSIYRNDFYSDSIYVQDAQDGVVSMVDLSRESIIIQKTSTAGKLLSVSLATPSMPFVNSLFLAGFFKKNDFIYTATTLRSYDETVQFYNLTFPMSNGNDAYVLKYKTDESFNRYPEYHFNDTIRICSGDDVQFRDGSIEENVLNDLNKEIAFQTINQTDSIYDVFVQVMNSKKTQVSHVCPGASFTFPDGTEYDNIRENISYRSVFSNVFGCDSVVNTELVVNIPDTSFVDTSICIHENYSFPDGSSLVLISDTVQISIISSFYGCDSVVESRVRVKTADQVVVNDTVCFAEDYYYHNELVLEEVLNSTSITLEGQNMMGCDSTTTFNIHVYQDYFFRASSYSDTLFASHNRYGSFTWFDCESDEVLNVSNDNWFVPSYSGSFYVKFETSQGCETYSSCIDYEVPEVDDPLSVGEVQFNNIHLSPNPSRNGFLQINGLKVNASYWLEVYGINGNLVCKEFVTNSMNITKVLESASGVYFVKVYNEHASKQFRWVTNR